jgi:protein arginine kinase activator
MIEKCFFCDKVTYTPFHVTDIAKDGDVSSYAMCEKCGSEYLKDVYEPNMKKPEKTDLSHIKTPEELLQFLTDAQKVYDPVPPCECGLTEKEFDRTGKFGCPKCYDHFDGKMESLVYPWHGAREHTGKIPRRQMQELWENDPVEKLKLLKLRYAKALELEEYEKLEGLQKEIDDISPSSSSTSEDQ